MTTRPGRNVLFIASTLPRFVDDQQAPFVLEQAQAWKSKRPEDRIIILAPHDPEAKRRECVGGVEIVRFQYFFPSRLQGLAYPAILPNLKQRPWVALQIIPFLVSEYISARRIIQQEKIDLIYAHWVMPQGLVASLLHRSTGVPYVIQNHSSDLSVFNKAGHVGRAVARTIIREAWRMFCVNYRQKEAALKLFHEPLRSEISNKVSVLPMGVGMDVAAVRPYRVDGAPPRFTLGTISRLSRKKRIDLLIAAVERLAENGRVARLAVAGDGEDRSFLSALPRRADVTFTGFLTGVKKIDFFNDTQLLAFPSVSTGGDVEGLPVALLEALCCGKVVIASRDTNIELLDEWEDIAGDVFLVKDPTNAIELATSIETAIQLHNNDLNERSVRIRRVMSRYIWSRLIDEYHSEIF